MVNNSHNSINMKEVKGNATQQGEPTVKASFGLQQKHIRVIEKHIGKFPGAMYSDITWESIGKEIGWLPLTAALWYMREIASDYQTIRRLMYWTAKMTKGLLDSGKSEADIVDQIEIKLNKEQGVQVSDTTKSNQGTEPSPQNSLPILKEGDEHLRQENKTLIQRIKALEEENRYIKESITYQK